MRAWLLSTPELCCEQAPASGTATTTPFTSAKFTSRLKERKLLMDSNGVVVILLGGRQAVLKREKAANRSLALPQLFGRHSQTSLGVTASTNYNRGRSVTPGMTTKAGGMGNLGASAITLEDFGYLTFCLASILIPPGNTSIFLCRGALW